MANKSLFDENHFYITEAIELENTAIEYLRDLFDDYVDKGYSPNEIEHVMGRAIAILKMEAVL